MNEERAIALIQERAARVRRFVVFAKKQQHKGHWVRLSRLALHHAGAQSPDNLETLADLWVTRSYGALLEDIRAGFFTTQSKERARLQLLYLHPSIPPARMTADWLELLLSVGASAGRMASLANTVGCCWVRAQLATAWCEARDLPLLSERRGPKLKNDEAVLSVAAQYREQGYSLHESAALAIKEVPGLVGASPDAIHDRIRRKLSALEK